MSEYTREQKIAEYNRKLDERVAEVTKSKIAEIKHLYNNFFIAEVRPASAINEYFGILLSELQTLQADRDKLISGLLFYANEDNWRGGLSMRSNINVDGGEKAQTILKEIGVNPDEANG